MKGLSLANMKKISEDKDSATFKHKDGHTIKIATKALSPAMKKELSKLPHFDEGGSTGVPPYLAPNAVPDSLAPSAPQPESSEQAASADDSPPKLLPDGTPVPQVAPSTGVPANAADVALKSAGLTPAPNDPSQPPSAPAQPAPNDDDDSEDEAPQPKAAAPKRTPQQVQIDTKKELSEEDQKWQQDLANGHITPQTYQSMFANKGTLGKIGTLFGLMVGGAGAGLTHQPNAILEMMNNTIKQDLDAQMQSKTNAQNMLRITQQHDMNKAQINHLNAATEAQSYMTANMRMNRIGLQHLVEANQKLAPGSPARIAGDNALALMFQSVNNENSRLEDRMAAAAAISNFGTQQSGAPNNSEQNFQQQNRTLRAAGYDKIANDREDKHFSSSGVQGQASVNLTSADRDSINSGIEFDQKLHRFMDWTKGHSGDLNPTDRNAGQALASELQGAYRQATHGGVYKEGEQNFISKLIDSDPTKFFNEIRVMPQLRAIAGENQSRVNQLVKSKGFQGYTGAGQAAAASNNASAQSWARANPNDPRAAKILKVLGQ